ncbi:MAG: 6-bladed beta-propeller [Tannerellaceae bacterium]|jgi:hypothetical protein|nr:6-bladed beta-propeller [Tannerellaceae bacterium]
MKKLLFLSIIIWGLFACNEDSKDSSVLISKVRDLLGETKALDLDKEIQDVKYISLKVTPDDASLIDGVGYYAITQNHIYIHPLKENRIVMFDKTGNFVKTLITYGGGPGELSGSITGMQADESNNILYIFTPDAIWAYTLAGEFISKTTHEYQTIYQASLGNDRFASVSMLYMPFQAGSFGLGIFSLNGDTIALVNNFYSPVIPPENSGFTTAIATAYSDYSESVLFKSGSSDTVYRIGKDTIEPVCVLELKNSDKEIVRSLDVTDFSSIAKKTGDGSDIFVEDMFETHRCIYFRFSCNNVFYVGSINKSTKQTLIERCIQPVNLRRMSDANFQRGMTGTISYNNFPVWGEVIGNRLIQIITFSELQHYSDMNAVSIPEELKELNEESNPVFVYYTLK